MNVVATIGHNNPPEPTPFELSREEIDGLYMEAENWLDGAGVKTQEEANAIGRLLDMLRKAKATADERRKVEAKPFDDGKAEVQARYNPLIKDRTGKADLAIDACKKAMAPFLRAQEEDQRAKALALAKEAEEKRQAAIAAMQSRDGTNLEESARAEALVQEAKAAETEARRADKVKAAAKGGARAVTLRDYYTAEVTDFTAFARHVWATHRDEMEVFLRQTADRLVSSGARSLPGVTVHHDRRPV